MGWSDDDRELVLWTSYGEEESSRGVSQFGGLHDSNPFTLLPQEALLYAYFDSFEREEPLTNDGPLSDIVRNSYEPRNQLGAELLVLRFDCVSVPYFNGAAEFFRDFYNGVRGENIDLEHDLDKEYWHGGEQTDLHVSLLEELYKAREEFAILYLVCESSETAERLLDNFFVAEGWIGLGITATTGKTPLVALFDHDDDQLQRNFRIAQLSSIVTLSEKRLNNLRHVFSVDFATDALMPPDDPDEPIPTPTPTPSTSKTRTKWSKRPSEKLREKISGELKSVSFKTKFTKRPRTGLNVPRIKNDLKSRQLRFVLQSQGIEVH